MSQKKSEGSSRHKFKIGIFGGTTYGKDEAFLKVADELGREIAARKCDLVYGGGIHGLSGYAAGIAAIRNSNILGIFLKTLAEKNISHYTIGTEIKVVNTCERIAHMFHNADFFIALPGGLGTLEGISVIASWAKLNFHRKPIGLLNINGFYDSLLTFLDKAVEQDFIDQATRSLIVTATDANQLMDLLQSMMPASNPSIKQESSYTQGSSRKGKEPDTTLRL